MKLLRAPGYGARPTGQSRNANVDKGLRFSYSYLDRRPRRIGCPQACTGGPNDHGSRAPGEAIRGGVLPGLLLRQGHRSAGEVRGPWLRGQGSPRRQGEARQPGPRQLGNAREADRRERGRLPAPGDPPEDRRAGGVLPRLQGGGDVARYPRRRHHHLREALHLHPDGEPARPGAPPDPRGAWRAARAGRPAPAPGAARGDPGRREPRHRGARGALRPARRAPDRRALRHHQRQAHAPEPLAHREPGRAQALP